ncbi:MAG: hypothetical protein JWM46_398 [Candidatus Kaiserbacteria bacterium]|nr:hypothetical protein [Candidatus Kaiserbacteria bacterium]
MVVQRTINNLKERSKDERKAVASAIAIGIIVILFLGWVILFFHRIRDAAPVDNTPVTASSTDTFDSHLQTEQPI